MFCAEVTQQFLREVEQWPVQALEYKSFLRFKIAKILDDMCGNQLQPLLLNTLLSRDEVIDAVGIDNVDNSDSYLRQPHRVLELHNDGTFVEELTDYVLMMKIDEQNMQGGNSLLLHLDDWEGLDQFFSHPLTAPPSKNVTADVFHPVFDVDQQGRPVMRYIDQFAQPKDFAEGAWLSELSDALEGSKNILSIPVPVGKFLLINNLFWLHGRDRFTPHPDLRRELMRQRGYAGRTLPPTKNSQIRRPRSADSRRS
ncbi:carbon starvation induced protein CsiD [Citrobacter sp. R56]|nr:carbon starvation induced protein CsiD [Citrobacter sp. R56]